MQRLDDRSRMSGDVHVRFCERLEGRFLRATRLRHRLSARGRCPARHERIAEALREIRTGAASREEPPPRLQQARTNPDERAGSQHLRLCRIHPLLGEVKAGILGHQAQDRRQKGQEDDPGNPGLVSSEPAQGYCRAASRSELEAVRSLPILWCAWQPASHGSGARPSAPCLALLASPPKQ